MCRLRTYLSLNAVKTSQNLPNDGATPTLRNGRVQLLSGHLDCFNGPRPAATSHKRPRKQRKVGLWNCLRAVRSDSPVLEGRPTVLHNIDHSNSAKYKNRLYPAPSFGAQDNMSPLYKSIQTDRQTGTVTAPARRQLWAGRQHSAGLCLHLGSPTSALYSHMEVCRVLIKSSQVK